MVLNVAVVGCGKIADGHLEEIGKIPERARVVAVCDRELLMAEQLAARHGVPAVYDSFDAMLERAHPEVVHITTPPQSHVALARAAIDAGAHVLVEKPLALCHADARALVEHAERAGKKLTIGYTYLFDPPALEMRRLIAAGALGPIVHVESWYGYDIGGAFGQALLGDADHWVHALPGKLFHNNIDHLLNKLVEFIDDDEPRIEAVGWRRRPTHFGDRRDDMLDELRVTIVGATTSASATFTSSVHPVAHFARVYGERNIMHVDYLTRTVTLEPGATLPSAAGRLVAGFAQGLRYLREGGRNARAFAHSDFHFFAGLHTLIEKFYDAILHGAPPPVPLRDILRISSWMDTIFAQLHQEMAA